MPVSNKKLTDLVFPKVFAHLGNRFREEKLGYELSAPLGGPEHELNPAVSYQVI